MPNSGGVVTQLATHCRQRSSHDANTTNDRSSVATFRKLMTQCMIEPDAAAELGSM